MTRCTVPPTPTTSTIIFDKSAWLFQLVFGSTGTARLAIKMWGSRAGDTLRIVICVRRAIPARRSVFPLENSAHAHREWAESTAERAFALGESLSHSSHSAKHVFPVRIPKKTDRPEVSFQVFRGGLEDGSKPDLRRLGLVLQVTDQASQDGLILLVVLLPTCRVGDYLLRHVDSSFMLPAVENEFIHPHREKHVRR